MRLHRFCHYVSNTWLVRAGHQETEARPPLRLAKEVCQRNRFLPVQFEQCGEIFKSNKGIEANEEFLTQVKARMALLV